MGVSAWPAGAPREETMADFAQAFQNLGFEPSADDALEPGIEKVALYALEGKPKHAARQLAKAWPRSGSSVSRPPTWSPLDVRGKFELVRFT
jgi:hypothetical protein